MSNIYIGYHFTIEPKELGSEILIAELGEKPFESFIETAQLNLSLFVLSLTGECVFNIGSEIVKANGGIFKGECEIPAPFLNDGSYTLSIMIVKDTTNILYYLEEPLTFEIADWREGEGNWYGKWPGIVRPKLPFTLNKIG